MYKIDCMSAKTPINLPSKNLFVTDSMLKERKAWLRKTSPKKRSPFRGGRSRKVRRNRTNKKRVSNHDKRKSNRNQRRSSRSTKK